MRRPARATADEHDDQPAEAGAPGGRQVQAGPQRLDRRDARGPPGRLEGRREGDEDADRDGGRGVEERQLRALERDRADRPEVGDHRGREQGAEDDPDRRPDEPDHERLGQDERADLDRASRRRRAAARPRGTAR